MSNSIKYTNKGRIFMSVCVDKRDERYMKVSVRDEGVGIKKEFRHNLFQAFGVAEDQESKMLHNPSGVGLGLLISNTIVKALKPTAMGVIPASVTSAMNNTPVATGSLHTINA